LAQDLLDRAVDLVPDRLIVNVHRAQHRHVDAQRAVTQRLREEAGGARELELLRWRVVDQDSRPAQRGSSECRRDTNGPSPDDQQIEPVGLLHRLRIIDQCICHHGGCALGCAVQPRLNTRPAEHGEGIGLRANRG